MNLGLGLYLWVCQMWHFFMGLHLVPNYLVCKISFHYQINQLQIMPTDCMDWLRPLMHNLKVFWILLSFVTLVLQILLVLLLIQAHLHLFLLLMDLLLLGNQQKKGKKGRYQEGFQIRMGCPTSLGWTCCRFYKQDQHGALQDLFSSWR